MSAANNNSAQGFRETGQMAVSSNGTVEAFWCPNPDKVCATSFGNADTEAAIVNY